MENNINKNKNNIEYDIIIDIPKIILPQMKNQWNLYFGEISLKKKSNKLLINLKNLKA